MKSSIGSAYKRISAPFPMKPSTKLAVAVLATASVIAIIQLLKLYRYSYDAYTHIFFADHYRRDWFNLWEPRWYGGFSVSTYPPLTHQLVALLGFIVGIENAYEVVSIVSAVILTYSVYLYAKIFLKEDDAANAALIAAFLPAAGLTLNAFGQLPTIFSTALALIAAYECEGYLSHTSKMNLILGVLWTTASGLAHHFTFLFFIPITLIPVLLKHFKREKTAIIKKTVPYVVITSFLLLIILYPFIAFALTPKTWVEIPHGTRENLFTDPTLSLLFFWCIYSFTILLLPNAVAIAFRRKELRPLFVVFMGLFVLGLGDVTPLPKIVLGDLWYVLTYDRFAFWATLFYTFFLAVMLTDVDIFVWKYYNEDKATTSHPRTRLLLTTAFLSGLIASYGLSSGAVIFLGLQPLELFDDRQLDEMVKFLDVNSQWMYVTLGFGSQRILLSLRTTAQTLDGGYNLAKTQPLLIESGVDSIDAARYYRNGFQFLDKVLSEEANQGLRYVLSADAYYDPLLRDCGLRPMFTVDGVRKVTVWEIPYAQKNVSIPALPTGSPTVVAWSLGPLATLGIAVFLTGLNRRKEGRI